MSGRGPLSEGPILHATLIAARRRGRWCGVLLQGPSGSGKSDLALRALSSGWRLTADDRVHVWRSGGALYGAAPAPLAGLIEVRGVGVRCEPTLPFVRLDLAVEAATQAEPVERMPPPMRYDLLALALPRLRLALLEVGTLARLERALDAALRREL
ncbi:HPr kinase/phosphorylase [Caulobacter sp. S45]|uniref:HPr kinase/phosphorylase n=1 Tax=Caulobacter sp. S45 TaxID=1641861 RepID=UPI0020C669FD|nr:HPr kinase/phosphorylase [Caulobacter sp. S45]